MDDEILIEFSLDDRKIDNQLATLESKFKKSLNAALGGNTAGGEKVTRAIKDQEAAALKLAQAQARLATAGGNLTGAQNILSTALAKTTKETTTQIGAQTQLITVQNRAARSARDLGNAMASVGTRLAIGVSAPLIALGVAAVKTAVDFDSLKRGLIAVSGSAEAADKQLVRLKEVAKLPGLGFKEAIQGSINLQAAGLSAERSERALKAFGNALATVGKGKTELQGVILALSQIESKGKVSAEEINQLAERIPQIRQIMLKAFGTADTEVIQRAKITSRQFIDTVVAELERLPKVTGGARDTFENLKDSIEQSLLPLGNKLLSTLIPAIERLSPKILGLLESFGKLSPATQDIALGFGAAAIGAGPFIRALGDVTNAVIALNAASKTGLMARLLSGPVVLTAVLVGTTAIQTFREATGNQEMIDRIGGPDLDRITGIMKQRGVSGADAFRTIAQELKDQALLAGLPKPEFRQPTMSAEQVFNTLGRNRSPVIDAVALAKANAAAAKAAGRGARDRGFVNDFGLGQTALLEHEAELARIRQSNAAVVERRNAEVDLLFFARSREFDLAGQQRGVNDQMGELSRAFVERQKESLEAQEKFNKELEETRKIALETDAGFRFMKGLRGETDAAASSFERLGQNIGNAFGDLRGLLSSLGNAVKQFFGDLLSATLRTAAASALAPLFGGGILGNLFRTPSFAGGISAPSSISGGGLGGLLSGIFGGGGASRSGTLSGSLGDFIGAGVPRTAGSVAAGGFNLSGFGGQAATALSLFGLQLGVSLGGKSTAGKILGGIGGGLGITSVLAAPLFIAGAILGRGKQRRADEEASGQFLTQALQGIEQLATGIATGQIEGSQARAFFDSQILGPFKQQISGLKTKSVVQSRLTNQVRDLENVYQARIPPLIAQQASRRQLDSKLIPEFATGGTSLGGLAILHPGEKVLNLQQQFAVRSMAGPEIFERAGVPGPSKNRVFDVGGTMPAGSAQGPLVINLDVTVGMSKSGAQEIYIAGASTDSGQKVVVNQVKKALIYKDL